MAYRRAYNRRTFSQWREIAKVTGQIRYNTPDVYYCRSDLLFLSYQLSAS